jgi:hypothetical protein
MGALLSNLSFLQPIILLAFISLPLLWLILRVTPPPPKVIKIPTFRFIKELKPEDHTSKDTPLWLLLLRLLAISLIIFGFAGPVLNAQSYLKGQLPPRIVIDNSWQGAAAWDSMIAKGVAIAEEAGRENLNIRITLTADDLTARSWLGNEMGAKEASARLKALEPQSWPADYKALTETLEKDKKSYHSYFLSGGLYQETQEDFFELLVERGGLDIFIPSETTLPYVLSNDNKKLNSDDHEGGLYATLKAAHSSQTARPLTINALDNGNGIIDRLKITPDMWDNENDKIEADIHFDLPAKLVSKVQRLQLGDQRTAASTLIVDPALSRKSIGLVKVMGEKDNKAYIGPAFYLNRALSPYADITEGPLSEILKSQPDIIILPDDIASFSEQLNDMQDWLEKGGILIRFSGPRLLENAQGASTVSSSLNQFLPLSLRRGGRSMGGELSWESAMPLAEFSEDSLFFGLPKAEDVKIKQMVLAEPGDYLDSRSWARLEDGTPIVTYDTRGNGLIVLFHVTATPDWSTLPLSGLYVEMLKRIIDLSAMPKDQRSELGDRANVNLSPIYTLGGYGQIQSPSPAIKPLSALLDEKNITLSLSIPPGLYAGQGLSKTLNLGNKITDMTILNADNLPRASALQYYQSSKEERPGSLILYIALLLLTADLAACFLFVGKKGALSKAVGKSIIVAGVTLFMLSSASAAQASEYLERNMSEYADNFYLAFIRSEDENLNNTVEKGLEELAITLNMRTSAEPVGIISLDVNNDELSFFPLIYWPVVSGQSALDVTTMNKIQNYLDHGGMILFDVQSSGALDTNTTNEDLRRLIGRLNIAPLEIVPEGHALSRSFYLLDNYPGLHPDYPVWVEQKEDTRIADAGSVLIGSNQWAHSWARGSGSNQEEMAMRFGVNLVMYALTGNYKTDQVHVKHILERLGE